MEAKQSLHSIIDSLGGRKFVLVVLALISITVLLICGKIEVDQFLMTLEILLGLFFGANAVTHLGNKAKSGISEDMTLQDAISNGLVDVEEEVKPEDESIGFQPVANSR
jgi:hypothetical protein